MSDGMPGVPEQDPSQVDCIAPHLEDAIAAARRGTPIDLASIFMRSDLLIPSSAPMHERIGDIRPITLDHEGPDAVAVYTNWEQIRAVADHAPYVLQTTAEYLVNTLVPGVGIAVNPRASNSVLIPHERLSELRSQVSRPTDLGSIAPDLERALADGRRGLEVDVMASLLQGELLIPTSSFPEVGLTEIVPVFFTLEQTLLVVVYTTWDIPSSITAGAPNVRRVRASEYLPLMQDGIGLFVNPGLYPGMAISPGWVASACADLI